MKQHKFALFPNFTLSPSKFIGKIISWLWNGHKKQMHYDVTLHDVTAIINQIYTAYRNSLLSPSGFYLFQVRSMRSDSWVRAREKNFEEGDTREPILTLPLALFPAHIFLILPRPHNLSQRLEWGGGASLNREGAYSALSNNQKMVLILYERKEQEFGCHKAEDRKLIQSSNVIGTSTSRFWTRHVHTFS